MTVDTNSNVAVHGDTPPPAVEQFLIKAMNYSRNGQVLDPAKFTGFLETEKGQAASRELLESLRNHPQSKYLDTDLFEINEKLLMECLDIYNQMIKERQKISSPKQQEHIDPKNDVTSKEDRLRMTRITNDMRRYKSRKTKKCIVS